MKEAQPLAIRLEDYEPPAYLIDAVRLEVDLYEEYAEVKSTLQLRRNPEVASAKELVLKGRDLELRALSIDGVALAEDRYRTDDENLLVDSVPAECSLETIVRIKPQENTVLEGLYKSQSMYCTQCEAEGFRRITWFLDRPDVLAVFTVRISADKDLCPVLLSNGNLMDKGSTDSGRHWAEWHDPFPKPCYLFALVAGDLERVDDSFTTMSGREVALQMFVEAKDVGKCGHALHALKQAMRWDEEVYGREYDLELFMIVAVDDFNMGAMENKGLNIFNTSCSLADPQITTDMGFERIAAIVAHEYFHNWSGNRVTCRDWFQLSLKEGFTVFRDAQFTTDLYAGAVKRIDDVTLLRTRQFVEDSGPMAHPVRPDSYIEINNFYTLTVYEKGAEVVWMIHELLGADAFRRGSDLYFDRHDGQAATVENFVAAMQDASGRDLSQFSRWYSQAGTPVLSVTSNWQESSSRLQLRVEQHTPATPGQPNKLPLHMPFRIGFVGKSEELTAVLGEEAAPASEFMLELTEELHEFEFSGFSERPALSLLRGFSAPVKLEYDRDADDLCRLLRNDSDGFSRWDAGQTLALEAMQKRLQGKSDEALESAYLDALRELLAGSETEAALMARILQVPAEPQLAQLCVPADPLKVYQVRLALRRSIGATLKDELLACYQRCASRGDGSGSSESMALRALKNACLAYLMLNQDKEISALSMKQYYGAENMTDRLAALVAIVHNDESDSAIDATEVLNDFYQNWQHETLVVNLWLQTQAACQVGEPLKRVQSLLAHPSYDSNNPNKVRSLIGSFAMNNSAGFHALDGSGYRFVADQVLEHDASNPRAAAGLLSPLTRWREYADPYGGLQRQELQRIASTNALSVDCYEIVSKSLAD